MSIQRMPDGTYVNIAEGTPPEVVARIRARYPAQRTPAPAPDNAGQGQSGNNTPAPRGTSLQRRTAGAGQFAANIAQAALSPGSALADAVTGRTRQGRSSGSAGLSRAVYEGSFHTSDIAQAGIAAGVEALQGRGNFGDNYHEAREGMRDFRNEQLNNNPVSSTVGGAVGAVAAPVGAAGRIMGIGGRAATRGLTNVAARTGGLNAAGRGVQATINGGERVAQAFKGPIGQGIAQGAGQAGLTTFADTGDVGQAAQSAAIGGAFGGVAGGVLGAGATAVRAFRDRRPEEVGRVAYDKIASMLGRGRDEAGNPLTPASARAEINEATAAGTPTTLGDLTHEMQGMRGEFARRTALPSAGDVALEAEQRLATAADRFADQVKRRGGSQNSGTDAVQSARAITAARKADAATDYAKGGALDKPLAPTPHIVTAIRKPTPDMKLALQAAKREFANDPSMGKFFTSVRRNGEVIQVPTTRAFDSIKKAFDDIINSGIQHLPDGNTVVSNASRSASKQIRALKDAVAKSNPEYAAVVGRQRDAFERLESLNAGRDFMKRMGSHPRELLTDLQGREAGTAEDTRTGLIDALLAMRNTRDSPIKVLRKWERNPQQRQVLEHVLGGPRAFNEFSKFMRRELRAMQADALTLRKSNNPVLNEFVEHGEQGTPQGLRAIMQGQAYGGVPGAISAASRQLDNLKNGMGPEAQEQVLRLLQGNGEGLEAGVNSARAVREARIRAARMRAQGGGRMAGAAGAAVNGTGE